MPPSEPSGRIRTSRPRGATAAGAAAAAPAMNIVRGWAARRAAPEVAEPMRVPQAPQKAKPAWTALPQLGQVDVAAGERPAAGRAVTGAAACVDGRTPAGRRSTPRRAEPGPASGFGGSWKRDRRRHLRANRSRGCRPWASARCRPSCAARPQLTVAAIAAAGSPRASVPAAATVRARFQRRRRRRPRAGGRAPAAGLRQLVTAAETELVVVLVFFAAAVAGDQMDPRGTYRN